MEINEKAESRSLRPLHPLRHIDVVQTRNVQQRMS